MTSVPYPVYPERTLSRRLWGGPRLRELLDLPDPGSGDPWGESWQVYGGNTIGNGPWRGRTLQEAADAWGAALLGSAALERYGTRFPLLAKIIGAGQDLSLQVHPDDRQAAALEPALDGTGKAEAWLVLEAGPGAAVYRGFRSAVTADQVRSAVAAGTLQQLLNRFEVSAGDVIMNPPGMVHAIGADIVLFEIQQPSDITFRLYDWARRDSTGQLRDLHVEQALAVADLSAVAAETVAPTPLRAGELQLVRSEHFVMTQLEPAAAGVLQTDTVSVELLTSLDGEVRLLSESGQQLRLPAGTSLVLPAVDLTYELSGAGRLIRCYLPPG